MEIQELEIAKISANNYNPNAMSNDKMEVLKRFITRFGFLQPVVVRKGDNDTYVVVDGEHRFMAMKALGKTTIPAVVTDFDDTNAKMQTINLNNLRGEFNNIKLAEVISELRQHYSDEDILDLLGFDKSELSAFDKIVGITPERIKFSEDELDKKIQDIELETASQIEQFALSGNSMEMEIVAYAIKAAKEVGDFTNDEAAVADIFEDFVKLH